MNAVSSAVAGDLLRALRDLLGDRVTAAAAVREHHSRGESYHTPAAPDLVAYPRDHRRDQRHRPRRGRARRADRGVRRRHVARGTGAGARRRRVRRPDADEPGAARQRGRPRRDRAGRRHPSAAQQAPRQHRADLLRGSWRRRHARRHDRHRRLRDDGRSLRDDARERAGTDGGAGRRSSDQDRRPRAQVVGRLRPDAAVRRLRGHARHHQRDHRAAAAACPRPWRPRSAAFRASTRRSRPSSRPSSSASRSRGSSCSTRCRWTRSTGSRSSTTRCFPTLFFEFHGQTEREVGDQAETVQALAAEHAGAGFAWVTRPEDRARLWRARHDSYYASLALRPGAKAWTTDACVPISRLAECIVRVEARSGRVVSDRHARRSRRRRQLPHALPRGSRSSRGDGRGAAA